MKKVEYTNFGKTKLVPHVTYTGGEVDNPPKDKWDDELWIEREEDWYALSHYSRNNKTVLIVKRNDFIAAEETKDSKMAGLEKRLEAINRKIKNDKFDVELARREWQKEHEYLLDNKYEIEKELRKLNGDFDRVLGDFVNELTKEDDWDL